MTAYLVRLKKNAELVGLFVSPSDEMLWEFVDECCDPVACEYIELPPGGLYLDESGAARVPTKTPYPEEDIPDWFTGATISELWLGIFYNPELDQGWQPLSSEP